MKFKRYVQIKEKNNDFMGNFKENQKRMDDIDTYNKENSVSPLGRIIREPYADGYAFYQVTAVKTSKVKIDSCFGISDNWIIPYWGTSAWIRRKYAEGIIKRMDALAKIFS